MAMTLAREGTERLELVPAATLFRSLGDLSRLAILRRLAEGPARVTDLVAALGLAQSTVSKHLACLRDCGLVASEPVGRASVFRLTQPSLIDVLAAAEEVLAATGSAVTLCRTLAAAAKRIRVNSAEQVPGPTGVGGDGCGGTDRCTRAAATQGGSGWHDAARRARLPSWVSFGYIGAGGFGGLLAGGGGGG